MKTDKLLHLVQQKKAMRSGGALPLPKAQDGLEPINLKEVTISGAVPDNVHIQSNIAQSSSPKKNYAIIDKVGNRIYYYKPSGELIKSESVITGKSNNDRDRGLSMKEWFEQTGSDSHEDYFKYLEENKYQTTPSGIFKISGKRTNTAQDPSLLGRIINTFRPERAAQIRESRLQDYGLQQKMFTLADENKKGSSKAIHGTNNPVRVDAFNNPYADRNLSNGCINVQGETICFDTLGRGSNIYIMPEEQMGYLYPKEVRSNLAELFNRKQFGGKKGSVYDALLNYKESPDEDKWEFFDLTGLTSWDDAVRGYDSWTTSNRKYPTIPESMDMFSAVPLVGRAKKAYEGMKYVYKPWRPALDKLYGLVDYTREEYEKSKKEKREGGLTKAQYGWMTTPGLNFPRSSKPVSKKAAAQVQKVEQEPLEKLIAINDTAYDSYIKDWEKINVFPELSGRTVNLTAGRYKGSEVPIEYMRMLYESAKKAGVDPMQSLAQGARETIFLQDYATKDKIKKGLISPNPEYLISGWNVDEEYEPYDAIRFLADKQVPGIKTKKGTHGYDYTFDEDELNTYLKKNPQLIEQYISKVQSTPKLPQTNYFDLYHDFVKRKGVKGYNAGDPNYVKQVNEDIQLLQSDPEFMKYYAKGFKKAGGLTKSKAREILHDKSVHGNPLTEKQRKFFGAIASGKKKKVKVNKPR